MMNKTKNNSDYILTKVKIQNFYTLYNSLDEKNNMVIKELFSCEKLLDNYEYDEYDNICYEELVNTCYSIFKLQLQLINNYIFNDNEEIIGKIYYRLPKNIINIVNKDGFENVQLVDIIRKENVSDINLHHLLAYVESFENILEMFFETDKYEERRKKYLKSAEGKEEAVLLEQVKLNMFN